MLSPEDIRKVEFDKVLLGYRCEEVDDYLKQVAQDLENALAAQDELRSQMVTLAQSIARYRDQEDTLANALLNAQSMGDRIQKDAKEKAVDILREANIRAENREQQSRETVEQLKSEQERLRREVSHFRANVLSMYEAHIHSLSSLPVQVDAAESKPQPEAAPAQATAAPRDVVQSAPRKEKPKPVISEPAAEEVEPDIIAVKTPSRKEPVPEPPVLPVDTKAPRRRARATVQPNIPDEPDTQEFGNGAKGRKKTPSFGTMLEDTYGSPKQPVLPDSEELADEEPLKSMLSGFNGISFEE